MNRAEALAGLIAQPLKLSGEEKLAGIKSALVIAPHQDDETLGCGGLILKLLEQKTKVSVVVLTQNQMRTAELYQAMETLGVTDIQIFSFQDRLLILQQFTAALERKFRELMRIREYGMVFLPYVFDTNPDHRAAVTAFGSAISKTMSAGVCMYEIWTPLLYPNLYLDITGQYEAKKKAIACYHSQLLKYPLLERDQKLREFRAALLNQKGCRQAEAFKYISAVRFQEMTDALYGKKIREV